MTPALKSKSSSVTHATPQSWRQSRWLVLLTIAMAVFTDVFLYAMIVPVMPFALKTKMQLEENKIQTWVAVLIAVYGGALAVASPICGWVCDQIASRRIPLLSGLIALSGSTVLLHLAPSIPVIVLARVLQGISAAIVWVVGMALLADTTPRENLGQSLGILSLAMTLGVLSGPLLGGVVYERAGYHAVFAMAYALLVLDMILRVLMLEPPKYIPTPEPGTPVSSIVYSEHHTAHCQTLSSKRSSCSGNTEKVYHDAQLPDQLVPYTHGIELPARSAMITLLRSRRMIACLWGIAVSGILMSQFDATLPIFVKAKFNWNATAAGLIFLPITLTAFFAPPIGWAIDQFGTRWFATGGFVMFLPFEVLLRIIDDNTIRAKVLLCFLLALISFCIVCVTPALLVEITAIIQDKERKHPGIFGTKGAMAQAYGLFNFAWALGSLIGPLWAGLIVDHSGWKTMTLTMAVLSVFTAIPTGVWTGGSIIDCSTSSRSIRAIMKDHQVVV